WKIQENPKENSHLIHFIGKDNIVFHCIIFPAILKAHGDYILPENIPANEFLNLEGDKLSTSRNHAVWLHEYLEEFPGKEDELRYVLTSILPETSDSEFTWKDFQARVNNELVAIFGNFINRVMVLSHKYFNGIVSEGSELTDNDKQTLEELASYPSKIEKAINGYRFREALSHFMQAARLGNKYLADEEPWKVIKTDEERVKTVLNIGLQIASNLAIFALPFLPFTAKKLFAMLNQDQKDWSEGGRADLLPVGHQLAETQLLFEKITDEQVEFQLNKLAQAATANQQANSNAIAAKPAITFDEFAAMDIRSGEIIAAEKVAKTKKLLKLTVDTGLDRRTIVSGIAEFFQPEDIIGQQVSVLLNLEPRNIKGIESQGMILMAEDSQGKLFFVAPKSKGRSGSNIR